MKLKSKTSKKKYIVIVALAIVVLGVGAYALYQVNQNSRINTDNTAEFQDADPVSAEEEKQQQEFYKEQKEKAAAETTEDPAQNNTLDVHFTAVNQHDTTVQIRAEISKLINNGTCTLTLTKGAEKITRTAATHTGASVSTCQGFDISTSDISPGTWNVHLTVTKDDQKGETHTTVDVS